MMDEGLHVVFGTGRYERPRPVDPPAPAPERRAAPARS